MEGRDPILIIGASGHGKVVADIIGRMSRYEVAGFLDRMKPPGGDFFGHPWLGTDGEVDKVLTQSTVSSVVVAIGDNWTRRQVVAQVAPLLGTRTFATVVHPTAVIAEGVEIGPGTVVAAGVVINPGSRIGSHVIVNTGSRVDHDVRLGNYSSVAPGATLGGDVSVGELSAIGLGACILHGRSIGERTVVGAGSVVTADIGDLRVAYGVPAKRIRDREPDEPYL